MSASLFLGSSPLLLVSMFDGLLLYELVLLSLGAFLFVVLTGLLVFLVVKHRDPKVVISTFVFPVAMIAFPGYSSITIGQDLFTLTKLADAVEENPGDEALNAQLDSALGELAQRKDEFQDPARKKVVERAEAVRELAEINQALNTSAPRTEVDQQRLAERVRSVEDTKLVDEAALRRVKKRMRPAT